MSTLFRKIRVGGTLLGAVQIALLVISLAIFLSTLKGEDLVVSSSSAGKVRKVNMNLLLQRIHGGSLSGHRARFFHIVGPDGK